MKKNKIFALYKGDKFLTTGTIKEISEYLGVSVDTARFYTSPIYKKRRKDDGNSIIVIFVCYE